MSLSYMLHVVRKWGGLFSHLHAKRLETPNTHQSYSFNVIGLYTFVLSEILFFIILLMIIKIHWYKAIMDGSRRCPWPAISRQPLYLKLTLPADADIPSVRDNSAHYANGSHCNVRSPLQGYAMPFLHSVWARTRCSLPSSFSRTFMPYCYFGTTDCFVHNSLANCCVSWAV